jgi:hypothetical protein
MCFYLFLFHPQRGMTALGCARVLDHSDIVDVLVASGAAEGQAGGQKEGMFLPSLVSFHVIRFQTVLVSFNTFKVAFPLLVFALMNGQHADRFNRRVVT